MMVEAMQIIDVRPSKTSEIQADKEDPSDRKFREYQEAGGKWPRSVFDRVAGLSAGQLEGTEINKPERAQAKGYAGRTGLPISEEEIKLYGIVRSMHCPDRENGSNPEEGIHPAFQSDQPLFRELLLARGRTEDARRFAEGFPNIFPNTSQ